MFLTTLSILFSCISISQENAKQIQKNNQQWIQYYNKTEISEKYTFLSDVSLRWKNELNDYSLTLLRFGVMYKLKKNIQLAAGLASTTSHTLGNLSRVELRGWQEILFLENISRINISNRLRIEERYYKNITNDKFDNGYNFNYRFRYRCYVTIPLNHSQIVSKTISINVGDEVFLNFGKEIIYNTLDNNRLILGMSYQLNNNQSIGLNYVSQFSQKNQRNSFEESDILWLSFTHNINYKRDVKANNEK